MKILFVITKAELAGAQTHVFHLTKYFLSKGNQVTIVSGEGEWLRDESVKLGAKFIKLKNLSNSLNPYSVVSAYFELRQAIKSVAPDVVAGHSSVAGFLARLATFNKIPTTFTIHGWSFEGAVGFKKNLWIALEKIAARFNEVLICESKKIQNQALIHNIVPAAKLRMIYNGIEFSNIEKVDSPAGLVTIIFIGRFSSQKDPVLLVEAYSNLPQDLKDKSQLVLLGDGDDRMKVTQLIESKGLENIRLLGNVSREVMFKELAGADCLALTTNWEGIPYTIIEAMSLGLPVIASDVGSISEVVNTTNGFLVPQGDATAVTKALAEVITSRELRVRLGQTGQVFVKANFSLEEMCKQTEIVFEQIVKK
jgi:glycosyltransferase involved in cell wall biosynthesis